MTSNNVKLLSKMKKLINEGKRKFQARPDRDYLTDLLKLGISKNEAWYYILGLNINMLVVDTKPFYAKYGEALNDEETVCLSFHKDRDRW